MVEQNNSARQMDKWRRAWDSDEFGKPYGDLFYDRATGGLPEMESSKAAAKRLAAVIASGDRLLDVGCGAGHYYRSIRRAITVPVAYTGLDATTYYIDRAREAFAEDRTASFFVGDIFDLPFPDRSFDVALCSNVLLHLPSIVTPLTQLCRVARRHLLVRTLIGERTFLVREVRGSGDEIDDSGEPHEFNWYNIYSQAYVSNVLRRLPRVRNFSIHPDHEFDPKAIDAAAADQPSARNATRMLGGWQVNGYVLQPWCFIEIELHP
jgi:ubiquinone/menaquinone biosynthesis C-methylase UbiE